PEFIDAHGNAPTRQLKNAAKHTITYLRSGLVPEDRLYECRCLYHVGRRARGGPMTHASTATADTRFAEGDFRVGRVLSRAISVLLRRSLTFFIVTFVAFLPLILLQQATANAEREPAQALAMVGVSLGLVVLMMMLSMLSSAVILHGAFQDMSNRPFNLAESLKVGLRRFLPLMGLGFLVGLLVVLGFI